MSAGDGIVIVTLSVVLGIVGYHVIGWWAPGAIIGSYAIGTLLNIVLLKLRDNAAKSRKQSFDQVMEELKNSRL